VDSNLYIESGWTRKHMAAICDTFHTSLNGTIGEGKPHTFNSKYRLSCGKSSRKKVKYKIVRMPWMNTLHIRENRDCVGVLVCMCDYMRLYV
jgi:hypothetical protein